MMYPLVIELAAESIPVDVSCRVLGFSRQAFYKWRANPISQRDWDDAHVINAALDIHADDPEFGYRLIADELHTQGNDVSEWRVQRLCSLQQIYSTIWTRSRRRGSSKTPGPAVADDHVRREFTATELDRIWLTDISEHPTLEGKIYICAIKDVCSRRIVGYAIDERMTARLATDALQLAIARRDPQPGTTIVHSDRGGQFRAKTFQKLIGDNKLVASMGRVASAADNAAMESFFALLQQNVLDRRRWDTRDQLKHAIIGWIETTYNRRRRQRALGKLTPVEFETLINPGEVQLAA